MGAAIAAVAKIVTAVGTAVTAVKAVTAKEPEPVAVTPTPTIEAVKEEKKPITEAPEVAKDIAKEAEKKRRRQRTRTLLTGPRGVLTEAPVARKTLLGE